MTRSFKILVLILALLMLFACTKREEETSPQPQVKMMQVNDGTGLVWVPILENLQPSPLRKENFTRENGMMKYSGEYLHGIDVSEHQKEIDWQAVADSGMVDFAFIRAGYRGYTEGGLFEDNWFRENIEGTSENGISAGVYFFSQAITPEEAVEEAEFLLSLIEGYEISLPIAYDWEPMHVSGARTEGLSRAALTDCALAFCRTVENAGYDTVIYIYPNIAYNNYDLSRLEGCEIWLSGPGDYPDFYYAHSWWQYTYDGNVPGIEGGTDMNLYFPNVVVKALEE